MNRQNHVLGRRLEQGLHRALANGSFDRLFYERFGDIIARAGLQDRLRIALDNPLLTAETPLDQAELWYRY